MRSNPHFPADLVAFTVETLNGKTSFFVQWCLLFLAFKFKDVVTTHETYAFVITGL